MKEKTVEIHYNCKIRMKEKFFQYLSDCYLVMIKKEYPYSIFHIYDPQFVRQKKLNRILEKENSILNVPNIQNGRIFFEQDHYRHLFWVDFYFLFDNNNSNGIVHDEKMMLDWIKKYTYLKPSIITTNFWAEYGDYKSLSYDIPKLINPINCNSIKDIFYYSNKLMKNKKL